MVENYNIIYKYYFPADKKLLLNIKILLIIFMKNSEVEKQILKNLNNIFDNNNNKTNEIIIITFQTMKIKKN